MTDLSSSFDAAPSKGGGAMPGLQFDDLVPDQTASPGFLVTMWHQALESPVYDRPAPIATLPPPPLQHSALTFDDLIAQKSAQSDENEPDPDAEPKRDGQFPNALAGRSASGPPPSIPRLMLSAARRRSESGTTCRRLSLLPCHKSLKAFCCVAQLSVFCCVRSLPSPSTSEKRNPLLQQSRDPTAS
jgi:hypothetical protein